MKTAISIPDPLFRAADKVARQLGMSRSELYRRALDAYLTIHSRQSVREALDRVYSTEDSGLDPVIARLQEISLPSEDW